MIELPNGKISRTLAEQVGFNSAKIAEIIKFLNESGLKDLVINLESDSGTLSTDQYAIAELSPSYMIYDGGVFYKVYEDASYIDYFLLQEQVAADSDMKVNHFRIRVERDSRNYALETVNIFTSYNKSQIDSIVSGLNSAIDSKAPLSGATFTGAVEAPTFSQTNANWSSNITLSLKTAMTSAGAVLTNIYNRLEVIGNILYLIINVRIANPTGSDITDSSATADTSIALPEEIGSLVYDFDGNSVHASASNEYTLIAGSLCFASGSALYSGIKESKWYAFLANRTQADRVSIFIRNYDPAYTLPAGRSDYLSARIPLTLI